MRTQTKTLSIELGDDDILRVEVLQNAEMTLDDAKESNAVCMELSGGRRLPRLCDYRGIRSQDRACRAYYASEETAATCLVCAIVISSPVSRVIGNFYMGLNKPVTPTRLFTSESAAVEWLRTFSDH